MAKTIKFNLICDDKPVRTIEDLQNNFSIEDVLAYYNNKLLHRWLEVRGYTEELEKVNGITAEKPIEIIRELIKIFNVVSNDEKVEESVYMLEYTEKKQKENMINKNVHSNEDVIIKKYMDEYTSLIKNIIENKNKIARIKATLNVIERKYIALFTLDARSVFYKFYYNAPLAVFALLMNNTLRNFYLPDKNDDKMDTDKQYMYRKICELVTFKQNPNTNLDSNVKAPNSVKSTNTNKKMLDLLGNNVKTFSGITDGYWKDIETKGKKYMIISMGEGDFVRSAGFSGGDLGSKDVLNKFVIVDGIDYKSNSATRQLLYMEV